MRARLPQPDTNMFPNRLSLCLRTEVKTMVHLDLDSVPPSLVWLERSFLPWKGCRHFEPEAHPSIPSRYVSEQSVVGDAEVTSAGQSPHALSKAEFKPFSAAGLRSKCSLVHGNKNHKKRKKKPPQQESASRHPPPEHWPTGAGSNWECFCWHLLSSKRKGADAQLWKPR